MDPAAVRRWWPLNSTEDKNFVERNRRYGNVAHAPCRYAVTGATLCHIA